MKIINRSHFLKLNNPTIFAKAYVNAHHITIDEEINILIPSSHLENDFGYIPLSIVSTIASQDSEDHLSKLIAAMIGKEVALEFDGSRRDGLFQGDEVKFAVYDQFDYARLLSVLIQKYNLLQDEYKITIEKVKAS